MNLPITDDHLNKENDLFKKFAFEPKIRSASSFLYLIANGVAQDLLYQLKYKSKKEVGNFLGKLYADHLSSLSSVDLIIPIPLHPSKLKSRGYNQSTYFAEGLGEQLNIAVREDLVERTIKTESQTSKSKVDRWENVSNVFSPVQEDLSKMTILVVDDVITTGATVGMFCERLVEANVRAIHLACIARGR